LLCFSSDGNYKYLIFGDKAGKLHAYEMKTNTEMPAIEKAHEDKIVDVRVLGNSNYIITASTGDFSLICFVELKSCNCFVIYWTFR